MVTGDRVVVAGCRTMLPRFRVEPEKDPRWSRRANTVQQGPARSKAVLGEPTHDRAVAFWQFAVGSWCVKAPRFDQWLGGGGGRLSSDVLSRPALVGTTLKQFRRRDASARRGRRRAAVSGCRLAAT